ncbi:hypothetical protein HDV04_004552 [Boothiomyces sp. JEL0838]|nr:hypothetical protein HDV04_004552 [Boothiomyces sp. JEL0838]
MDYHEVNEIHDLELKSLKKHGSSYIQIDQDNDDDTITVEDQNPWTASVVPTTDDPNTLALTFRVLFFGVLWCVCLGFINTLFSFRKNPFRVPPTVVTLLSYPMGVFMEVVLPENTIFNPGPFTIKEHVLIVLMAVAGGSNPYGVDNVVAQYADHLLNDKNVTFLNSLAWVLSSQMIGLGVTGMCRRFLVKPSAMVWPKILPEIALYTSFHDTDDKDVSPYKLSRYSFFWIFFAAVFVYQWLPGYFFTSLGLISVLCLVSSNRTVRFLGSGDSFEGPGILSLSFDWTAISHLEPLTTPFWASLNLFFKSVFWLWIAVPIVYYWNPYNSPKLQSKYGYGNATVQTDPVPVINSNRLYDSQGLEISPINFVTGAHSVENSNGPFFMSASFVIIYLCHFMNITAIISHVFLWHGSDIYRQTKEAFSNVKSKDFHDIHNKLMDAYLDLADWMYLIWFGVFAVIQVLVCTFTPFHMPIWATILSIAIGVIMTVPVGIIQAISGAHMGINVLTELVVGFLLPGQIVPVMTFKSLGYNVMLQALFLTKDLKIGHYLHISPISIVLTQLLGIILGSISSTACAFFVMETMQALIANPNSEWGATAYTTFVTAGGIWGAIGPARFFGPSSPYFSLLLGFPIGFLLPFIPWYLNKVSPKKFWKYVNIPLLTIGFHAGSNQATVVVPFLISYIFNVVVFKYRRQWWDKYNFILACALDSGVAVASLIIIFWDQVGSSGKLAPGILTPQSSLDFYCLEKSN